MRALLSLVLGTVMLNMSVHAGSATRSSNSDDYQIPEEDLEDQKNSSAEKEHEVENFS